MRIAVVWALVVAGLATVAVAVKPDGPGVFGEQMETSRSNAPDSRLVAFTTTVGDKYEQLTVIDPTRNVILVYHVGLASGDIELRCVRNIEPDLQLYEFNGKRPLPSEIRSQLGFR